MSDIENHTRPSRARRASGSVGRGAKSGFKQGFQLLGLVAAILIFGALFISHNAGSDFKSDDKVTGFLNVNPDF